MSGEVAEWLIVPVSKTGDGQHPWVQIPASPPTYITDNYRYVVGSSDRYPCGEVLLSEPKECLLTEITKGQ